MPSAPPCGTSTSALNVYDELRMLGASPFGVPVIVPLQVNWVRPAARLGRGETTRVAAAASSGSTWYLAASVQNSRSSSFTFSGYFAATSSDCVQSFVRSYSSHERLDAVGRRRREIPGEGEGAGPAVLDRGGQIPGAAA